MYSINCHYYCFVVGLYVMYVAVYHVIYFPIYAFFFICPLTIACVFALIDVLMYMQLQFYCVDIGQ